MEIEIKNFGPISYLKFDLAKDIHLIYGKNAIGKSYATYLIYCLLKTLKNHGQKLSPFLSRPEKHESFEEFLKVELGKLKVGEEKDITQNISRFLEQRLQESLLPALENSLNNTFSSLKNLQNRFSGSNFEIRYSLVSHTSVTFFPGNEGNLLMKVDLAPYQYRVSKRKTELNPFCLTIDSHVALTQSTEGALIEEAPKLLSYLIFKWFSLSDDSSIRDIYYLPASRSGLYQALNSFTPIIAELTQNRFFLQNKNIELPSLSEPLADYFIDLSTVDRKHENTEFVDAIAFLQEKILNGEVDYDDKRKKIMFKPAGTNLDLNLSDASSMVSELSPLAIYLKHIFNHKYTGSSHGNESGDTNGSSKASKKGTDILFIEEPEAHLHPEVQVLLVELFAMLSKQGLKIFMTSHSNYMFNKLNNLLIGGELDENKVEVYHLVSSPLGTIRNENMKVSKEGVDDENFQETSEKLYMERMALLEAQHD